MSAFAPMLAVSCALLASASGANAAPGALDPTFGAGGVSVFPVDQRLFNYVTAVALQADGRLLIASYGGSTQDLYRLRQDGSMDPSFGLNGRVVPATSYVHGLQVQTDGKFIACGGSGAIDILRYRSDGTLDPGYGKAGIARVHLVDDALVGVTGCALDSGGRTVASGYISEDGIAFRGVLARVLADGTPDPAFGTGGVVQFAAPGQGAHFDSMTLQADGRIIAGGSVTQGGIGYAALVRYRADGTLDTAFGNGGVAIDPDSATLPLAGSMHAVAVLPAGRIVAAEQRKSEFADMPLLGFTAAGVIDAGFGTAGVARSGVGYVRNLIVQPDGKLLLSGAVPIDGQARLSIARLSAAGVPDPLFGTAGIASNAAAISGEAIAMALGIDGKVSAAGPSRNAFGGFDLQAMRVFGDEIVGTVVEFYNTTLDHYFVTADPVEAAAIDGGAAGPGWSRTGFTFKSGGIGRVCRFYGSIEINPATGTRRGPNSHFYTVEAAECGAVRQDPGWHFESYDFGTNPRLTPACPAGTVAVYRAYNGRFAQNDSNHRLTTNLAAYNQTLARGWTGEGAVMCAPE